MHAFGINLSQSAWTALTKGLGFAEIFGSLLLLLIMIGANYYQQVQITNLNPMVRQNQQMNSQMQLMRFFPIIFGLICIRLPSGLVLYYAVSALFRVGQQWMMYHYDPKVIALVAKDDRDIEVMEARLDDTERKRAKPTQSKSPRAGPPPSKPPPSEPVQPKPSQAKMPQAKSPPKSLPPGQNGAPNGGNTNGQVPSVNPSSQANGQRNRSRRRKGR